MKRNTFKSHLTYFLLLCFPLLVMCGCRPHPPEFSKRDLNEQSVLSLVWYQNASEVKALCYQAFNTARMMLDKALERNSHQKKPAVVVDIDETILDNSPWEAELIDEDVEFTAGWEEWCDAAEAEAVPGAVEFLSYASERGADIFYVSNRDVSSRVSTVENLKNLGFPQVLEDRLLLMEGNSDKEPRRRSIEKDHTILLLIGDNLNDFDNVFRNKAIDERKAAVERLREEFGKRFIILPNPMYGDWERAVYGYDPRLSPGEKSKARKAHLKGWKRR